jgi:hypothetical protein
MLPEKNKEQTKSSADSTNFCSKEATTCRPILGYVAHYEYETKGRRMLTAGLSPLRNHQLHHQGDNCAV